jgi:endo-1,4-beta-D-glucanase Y
MRARPAGGRPVSIMLAAMMAVGALVVLPPAAASPATRSDVPASVRAAGAAFLDRYEQRDGRVVRWDQGGDTVSEGEGYAMLVAAGLGWRGKFDAAWRWTEAHLRRPTGLFAWHWQRGSVVDPNSAADADVDIAWALATAARRFHAPSDATAARQVAGAVLAQEVVTAAGRPVLVAGHWALGPPPMTDPSYFQPVAFARLGALSGDPTWRRLEASGLAELTGLLADHGRLPPDWAGVAGDGAPYPAASPHGGGDPRYGYDAVRVPVELAAACAAADRGLAARIWHVLGRRVAAHRPLVDLSLAGSGVVGGRAPAGEPAALVGAAGAADGAGQVRTAHRLLHRAGSGNRAHPTYYGAAWVALGRLLLQTHALGGCAGAPR